MTRILCYQHLEIMKATKFLLFDTYKLLCDQLTDSVEVVEGLVELERYLA